MNFDNPGEPVPRRPSARIGGNSARRRPSKAATDRPALPAEEKPDDFQTFFELACIGNAVAVAPTWEFARVNRTLCEITGYSEAELLKKSGFDLTHPADVARDRAGWEKCVRKGDSHFSIEKRYIRKDGTVIWVHVNSTLIRDAKGAPLHALGVIRDITDRRHAVEALEDARTELERRVAERTAELAKANTALSLESAERARFSEQLRESNQTLATLIEASPLAIIALNANDQITMWNPAAEELLGWTQDEVLGRSLLYLPPGGKYRMELQRALLASRPVHLETIRERKDQTQVEVGLWCAPLGEKGGETIGHVVLLRDASEQKLLERALLEASEREQRRIGQDLHDHLCQHLLGAALAAKAIAGSLQGEGLKAADDIQKLAELLNSAVEQVRDIARGLNPVEMDAAGLMTAMEEMARRVDPLIPCGFECPQPVLLVDPETALHVYRIAQEAVTNAMKHAEARRIVIRLKEQGETVYLQVADDGRGLSLLAQRGRGMGLDSMKYRAHAIRGRLTIETLETGGTSVTCTFPKSKQR